MTWLMINVPLMIVFVAFWVGIPTWLVLKHPDSKPALAAAPAVRTLTRHTDSSREDVGYRHAA